MRSPNALTFFLGVLVLTAPARSSAWFENLIPAAAAAVSGPQEHELKRYSEELSELLKASQERRLDQFQNGKLTPAERWLDTQLHALEVRVGKNGLDQEVGSLAQEPALQKALGAELKAHGLRPQKESTEKAPTVREIQGLVALRMRGSPSALNEAQWLRLATVLQLENQARRPGGANRTTEQLLERLASEQLMTLAKDRPTEIVPLPPALQPRLLDRFIQHYLKDLPEKAAALRARGLTGTQLEKLLHDHPRTLKNLKLTVPEWLSANQMLGWNNFRKDGSHFNWDLAQHLFHNRMAQLGEKTPPGFFERVRDHFIRPFQNPPQGPFPPGKFFTPGDGPAFGQPGGPRGTPGPQNFEQPPMSDADWLALGYPTEAASIHSEERSCLASLHHPSGSFAVSFKGDSGVYECGFTPLSKNPEAEKLAAAKAAAVPGARCVAYTLTAKHCLNHGIPASFRTSLFSQVFGYGIDVEKDGPPISGGDDHVGLRLQVLCSELARTNFATPMPPAQFASLPEGRVAALLFRNRWVNHSDHGSIAAEINADGDPGSAFATFNANVPDLNHGEPIQEGDSGGAAVTCGYSASGQLIPFFVGLMSHIVLNGPFPRGLVGGIASGSLLAWLNTYLPGPARPNVPDFRNFVTRANDPAVKAQHTF